jgi:uncharacterized phage protein (TIGR01671 family)|nr:MAG TPA: YopX protein [Caudoviricetes sp.]
MQDRFKFRYHNNNKIYDVSAIDFTRSRGEIVSLDRKETLMCKLDLNNLIQCTGLKDKNGKLIYEADIVKYKDEVYDLCIGRIKKDNAHYELQYYTGEQYGWFSHILCFKHIKNMEVIGNIYENPELLEKRT